MKDNNFTIQELRDMICNFMGTDTVPSLINKHINEMILSDNMSPKEIARCIDWYVEVKNNKLDSLYGIRFLNRYRTEVNQFFRQLELDQRENEKRAKEVVKNQDNNIIFKIKYLDHRPRKPKQIDINSINIEGD